MSRNTVARLLASGKPPRYRREPAGLQLDPFKDAVLEMLGKDAGVRGRRAPPVQGGAGLRPHDVRGR